MKAIYKSLLVAAFLAPLATGCIEEEFPATQVTQEQLLASRSAAQSLAFAMPAAQNAYDALGQGAADVKHYDFGNPAIMQVRNVMTGDVPIVESGYNWFSNWQTVQYMGPNYIYNQMVWNYFCKQVLSINNCIGGISHETTDPELRSYLGAAFTFRASTYLEWAQMYEFAENNYTQPLSPDKKNDILGLTVPIVTEETSEELARNNPRATREAMIEFIHSDLEKAIEYFNGAAARPSKTLPNLAVAYGVYARLLMWEGNYPEAAKMARQAITVSGATPTTREQWLSTTSGFNDLSTSSWLWGQQLTAEDNAVKSGIINWTSFLSNETTFGYASAGPFVMIDKSLYDKINPRDWRKLSYIAPEGSSLRGQEPVIDEELAAEFPTYASLKFRPGQGNIDDNKVACAVGIPLMRVEEMYLIEAEAKAHTNPAEGKALIEDFMKTYRYAQYAAMNAASVDDVVNEIILQKRIELWGEGITFFDIKRLNMSVTRYYDGTNFQADAQFNTIGRPAWMNFCIVQTEANNNEGVNGYNNPDPEVMKPAGQDE